jgi:signal peptidase I
MTEIMQDKLPATQLEDATQPKEKETPKKQQVLPAARSVWWELGSLAVKIVLIFTSFMLIFTFMYGFHRNTDPDMAPMVKEGDLILFYRLDRDYAIGDLLLLDFQGERQVRRVVARAGDTVDIGEGGLIINGGLQNEPEIFQQTWRYENGVSFPLTVGEGQVFALGDARENATDSRVYGPVDTEDTLGEVITVIRRRGL